MIGESSARTRENAPRLRDSVSLVPHEATGGCIVADPEGRRHFRVDAVEGRLLALLDGCHTLTEIHHRLTTEFPNTTITRQIVAEFVERLQELGLLEGSCQPARRSAARAQNLLYFQIPLGNPDRFFRAVVRRCPFLFTRPFWTAAAALIAVALWTAAGSWSEIRQDGLRFNSLSSVLLMWASFFVIGVVHEAGHGLTCTYYGAPATRWGLLFMYLLPCAYCDVSAAWTLPKKGQRLKIGAAGLAFQWVAGALAILLWRVVEPGTPVARVLATMAGTCGLASLLNLWPFMRLDGYYMLCDLLEVPNLRTRSVAQLKGRLGSFLLGLRPAAVTIDPREERILAVYGIGVAVWSGVMVWIMANRLSHLFVGWWGGLAAASLAVALVVSRRKWLQGWMRSAGGPQRGGSGVEVTEKRRRGALPPLALAAGAVLLLGRWELVISSPCRLESARRAPVRATADGVLAEFRFQEGDRVRRGARLGTMDTFDIVQQLRDLKARRRALDIEQEVLTARMPMAAAQVDQQTAESRAGLERARTDLTELTAELPERVREAASRSAQAAAEARQAQADLEEARARADHHERIAARLRADLARATTGSYPPALAALSERVRKCRADRELAERERERTRLLVEEGAVAGQTMDRAEALAEVRTREEQAARRELGAAFKALREATEDAEAEQVRRQAALRSAAAAAAAAGAGHEAARRAERRVRAQCRPEELSTAQRQVEARDSALTAAVARRGEINARRKEVSARGVQAERLDAQIAVLRRRLRDSMLVSPCDGVLTTARVEERVGRRFRQGEVICAIEKPRTMAARVFVPEKEIGAIRVGQTVHLKAAPFPERTFTGRVQKIAPVTQRRGNEIVCEVSLHVPNPDGDLRAGMSGWAKIACGQQPIGALLTRRLVRFLRTEAWSWF